MKYIQGRNVKKETPLTLPPKSSSSASSVFTDNDRHAQGINSCSACCGCRAQCVSGKLCRNGCMRRLDCFLVLNWISASFLLSFSFAGSSSFLLPVDCRVWRWFSSLCGLSWLFEGQPARSCSPCNTHSYNIT